MKKSQLKYSMCSLLLVSGAASADISFNGFATLAGGITGGSDEQIDGYDDTFRFDEDSVFGIQGNADLGNGLSAVLQVITKGNEDWDAEIEWAYLGYEVNDNFKLIAGRQRAPFFLYSDFLDVGYAYSYITPPEGVYDLPITSIDGIGSVYNFSMGEADSTVQLILGKTSDDIVLNGTKADLDAESFVSAAWTVTYDWLTLRVSYAQTDLTVETDDFTQLGNAWIGAGFEDVANNLLADEDDATFVGFAATIDKDNWLFVVEYTDVDTGDNVLAETESYYATLGYRFDEFLVHFTYGGDEDTSNDYALENVPFPTGDPQFDGLYLATTSAIENLGSDETYYAVGLRWDFHPSAALKFEYKDWENDYTSKQGQAFDKDEDAGLFRMAITTVF